MQRRILFRTVFRQRVKTPALLLCLGIALLQNSTAQEPSAKEILQNARINQISQQAELDAQLRTGRDTVPFRIVLSNGEIRYQFPEPQETVILRLKDDSSELLFQTGDRAAPIRPAQASERVRNSSLTYEDLALRFLYWPGNKYLGTDVIRTRSAHRLELHPHDRKSLYGAARVWIDQQSGALLRVEGYDWDGKLTKRFEVVSAQRIEGQWFLKSMRVETFDADTRKVIDRTYLDVLGKPEPTSNL